MLQPEKSLNNLFALCHHLSIYLFIFISLYLPSIYLYAYISSFYLSLCSHIFISPFYLSLCLHIFISSFYLSLCSIPMLYFQIVFVSYHKCFPHRRLYSLRNMNIYINDKKVLHKEHGSVTYRPSRKLWQTDRPTNRPTDRREVKLPINSIERKIYIYDNVMDLCNLWRW